MTPTDEIRARLDIVDVVGAYVPLQRAGRIYKGRCPFHEERTPSFVVFPDSGNWRCFGACASGGDVFTFVMRAENLDFRGAMEVLAKRAGVALAPPSPAAAEQEDRRERLMAAAAAAAAFYHHQLTRSPAAEPARAYLRARGFGLAVAQAFQLGWAPDDGAALAGELRRRGFGEAELVEAGLARPRDGGGIFDTFRGRVAFPIHDPRGRAIGFGARTLDPHGVPKYLNSPQSAIFDKSHVLFGLHAAARAIRAGGVAVVVEGYTDVVRAHTAGFDNVVASLGTALTDHQVTALKRFARTIVLALDADAAGQAATLRGLEVARAAAAGAWAPVVTGRGPKRYERRSDIELRVATLPAGKDPDDVIRDDPARWRDLIAGAQPVLEYLFAALTADLDLADAHDKLKAVDRLVPVIDEISDVVARHTWVATLAQRLQIAEKVLATRLTPPGSKGHRSRDRAEGPRERTERSGWKAPVADLPAELAPAAFIPDPSPDPAGDGWAAELDPVNGDQGAAVAPPSAAVTVTSVTRGSVSDLGDPGDPRAPSPPGTLEGWLLGHLVLDPPRLKALDAALRKSGQSPLERVDFSRDMDRDLVEAVRYAARGAPPPDAPAEHRLDALPAAMAAWADDLRARAAAEPAVDERVAAHSLRAAVLRLRKRAIERTLLGLQFLLTEARAAGLAEDLADYNHRVNALRSSLLGLTELLAPRPESEGGKVDRGAKGAQR